MASDDLKLLVAREIASGETVAEVARRHSYTWKGMKKLLDTPGVQQLVEAERQRIGELAERCRVQLLQLAPEALANIAAVLRNARHPKRLETSRFVLEKILPGRTTVEANVTVNPAGHDAALLEEATVEIAKSLRQLSEAQVGRPHPSTRVRTGAEALPRASLPAGGEVS